MARDDAMSPEALRVVRRGATRVLFAASVLFVPAPFSIVFFAGLLPLAAILAVTLWVLLRMLATMTGLGALFLVGIVGVQGVVDGGLLYLLSAVACWFLFALLPTRIALRGVGLLVAVEVVASLFPIYFFPRDDADTSLVSLWGLVRRFFLL
jgi:hypothetical protein